MQRFIFIILLSLLSFVSYSQEAGWFIGTWKAGSLSRKRSTTQNLQNTFTITTVTGNSFEGVLQVKLITDTSVHLDSKLSGTISRNYLSAKLGEVIYKKDPPGGRWETKCNTCGPIQFVYSMQEQKVVLTGETKNCLRPCNGISVYSRDSSQFDAASWASLRFLITGQQDIARQTTITTDTTSVVTTLITETEFVKPPPLPVVLQKVTRTATDIKDFQQHKILIHAKPLFVESHLADEQRVRVVVPPAVIQPITKAVHYQSKTIISNAANPLLVIKTISAAIDTVANKPNLVSVEEIPVIKKLEVLKKRTTTLIKTFVVTTDSVLLRVFDNGAIDGDTISVLYNDVAVVNRLGLTAHAYEIKIAVNKTGDNKLVLYAHNLGEIPPNSALLEIYSGKKMYSLTVTSDLKTSSGITLTYQKQ